MLERLLPTTGLPGEHRRSILPIFWITIAIWLGVSGALPALPPAVFEDSFTDGSLDAWSGTYTPAGGDLSVASASVSAFDPALRVNVEADSTYLFAMTQAPLAEEHLHSALRLDPNGLAMAPGASHQVFTALSGDGSVFDLRLGWTGSTYRLRSFTYLDDGTPRGTPWVVIDDAPVDLWVEWWSAERPGRNDGGLRLWVDGAPAGAVTGLDNDEKRVEVARAGLAGGLDAGTVGSYFLDDIRLWRGARSRATLLADRFEDGTLQAWHATQVVGGGGLSVTAGAALGGDFGLEVAVDSSTTLAMVHSELISVHDLGIAFELDPGSLSMEAGTEHGLLAAVVPGADLAATVELGRDATSFRIRALAYEDGGGAQSTGWASLQPGAARVRLELRRSESGMAGGSLRLWVDGSLAGELVGLDNSAKKVERLRFGAVGGLDATTTGTYALDEFHAWEERRPGNRWGRLAQPTDSPFWWTLTPQISPPELALSLTSPETHRQRYQMAKPLAGADEVARVTEYVAGTEDPDQIPMWLAFDSLTSRLHTAPDKMRATTGNRLAAAGLSEPELATVLSAVDGYVDALPLSRSQVLDAINDLDDLVVLPAAAVIGEKAAVEARDRRDAETLASAAGRSITEVETFLTEAIVDARASAVMPVLVDLQAGLSASGWETLRSFLFTEIASGISTVHLDAPTAGPFGALEWQRTSPLELTGDYTVDRPYLSQPGLWQVVVYGSAVYTGHDPSHVGKYLIVGCELWESSSDRTHYEPEQRGLIAPEQGAEVWCTGVGFIFPSCGADGGDTKFEGTIAGAIGGLRSREIADDLGLGRRSARCEGLYPVVGKISGLAPHDQVQLILSWTSPQGDQKELRLDERNGAYAFAPIPSGSVFTLGGLQTLQGESCTAARNGGTIQEEPFEIDVECTSSGPHFVAVDIQQAEPVSDNVFASLAVGPSAEELNEVEAIELGFGSHSFAFNTTLSDGQHYQVRAYTDNIQESCSSSSGEIDGSSAFVSIQCTCDSGSDYCDPAGNDSPQPEPGDPQNQGNTVIEPIFPIGYLYTLQNWYDELDPVEVEEPTCVEVVTQGETEPCPQEVCPTEEVCFCETTKVGLQCSATQASTGASISGPTLSLSLQLPIAGELVVDSELQLGVTAADPQGLAGFIVLLDGRHYADYYHSVSRTQAALPLTAIPTSHLPEGQHSATVVAIGERPEGMVPTGTQIQFRVDRDGGSGGGGCGDSTSPTITLASPPDGAQLEPGSYSVRATASDSGSGVSWVDFYASGQVLGRDSDAPYEVPWTAQTGTFVLSAQAEDGCGNRAFSTAHTVTVQPGCEAVAPYVDLFRPAHGAVVAPGPLGLQAFAYDSGSGIDRVEFRVDGALVASATASPFVAFWNATLGNHSIQAVAFDHCGNSTASSTHSVSVQESCESVSPVVTLTQPVDGAQIQAGDVVVAASATDNVGVVRVDFLIDGQLRSSDPAPPFSWTWSATPGVHTIQARALDGCGNSALSPASTVTVLSSDATAPTVELTAPLDGSTHPAGVVLLRANASDVGSQVEIVRFYVDGQLVRPDAFPPYLHHWIAEPGTFAIHAEAEDSQGNVGVSPTHVVTITDPCDSDSAGPAISIASPAPGIVQYGDGTLPILATATDPIGVDEVRFYVDGILDGVRSAPSSGSNYQHTWTIPGPARTYDLHVEGRDSCGNWSSSAPVTVTVRIGID